MTTLFKKRTFSDFFSDTITFFKSNGRNYFKNYLIINGGFLMIIMVLLYLVIKVYFEQVFGAFNNPQQASSISNVFKENPTLTLFSSIIFIVLIISMSTISYSFPVFYMKLLENNKFQKIETSHIFKELKENSKRIFLFLVGSVFIVFPIAILCFVVAFLLCFVIIGIPILLLIVPTFLSWYSISFFDYLTMKTGFFQSFSNAFKILKKQFSPIVGGTFLALMILQVFQSIATLIPYSAGLIYFFASASEIDKQQPGETLSVATFLFATIFIFSLVLNYFCSNFFLVSQGMMYYGGREIAENNQSFLEIDNIGNSFE